MSHSSALVPSKRTGTQVVAGRVSMAAGALSLLFLPFLLGIIAIVVGGTTMNKNERFNNPASALGAGLGVVGLLLMMKGWIF